MNRSFLKYCFFVCFFLPFAYAHWADLAAAEITVEEQTVAVTLTFPTGLLSQYDEDKSGRLSTNEIENHSSELEAFFAKNLELRAANSEASLKLESGSSDSPDIGMNPGSHSTVRLVYTFSENPTNLTITYKLFIPGVSTASCLATLLQNGKTQTFVFTPENPTLTLTPAITPFWQTLKSFVLLGTEHIWTGYDHILFLLTLLMLGGGLGYLLKVVSAFTLAHSVTLSLAVFGLISLPGRLVESGIALSIAYVAAENLLRNQERAARWRWLLTFGFGLIHGLGFAGILQKMAIPRENLGLALLSFNLGVELGQLVIVALAFMVFFLLNHWRFVGKLRWAISATAFLIGLFWFVERAFVI